MAGCDGQRIGGQQIEALGAVVRLLLLTHAWVVYGAPARAPADSFIRAAAHAVCDEDHGPRGYCQGLAEEADST